MSVDVSDLSPEALRRYDRAAKAGLGAAAELLTGEIRRAFGSWYYLGGKYRNTLGIRKSINWKTPVKTPFGWESEVGTKFIVAAYWELGFRHAKNGKFYRVPIWQPTAVAQLPAMRAAFARVAAPIMEQP